LDAKEKDKIKNSKELPSEITETDFISLEEFLKKLYLIKRLEKKYLAIYYE